MARLHVVTIGLNRELVNFLDQERRRLQRVDPENRKYTRGAVILAMIEAHKTKVELAQLVEEDRRLLYSQIPEEWDDIGES